MSTATDGEPVTESPSTTIALTGSGGTGVVTAGQMLLEAAARAGWYGLMRRSSGPQIRGGESAALLRLATRPVVCPGDDFDLLLAFDWLNVARFAAEIPLRPDSLILADPAAGPIPEVIAASGARVSELPLKSLADGVPRGRLNMVGLGVLGALLGIAGETLTAVAERTLRAKGAVAVEAGGAAIEAGYRAGGGIEAGRALAVPATPTPRWNITGNEASGLGVLRGGVRFVAAYPITPASEMLEWLAPRLDSLGGTLLQAEDELASINMAIGASFGGVPAFTATSGPGLALMLEGIGLAVASETPVVVTDVMRGGPSTGIPTKSEQSDLNIALYGLHGDAPHLVLAPLGIADCLFTHQWAVHLAETLQAPAIVLSDQNLGQSRGIIDRPAAVGLPTRRRTAEPAAEDYRRYAVTADGVSPMALPGQPGLDYTADGLEHDETGTPSSQGADHGAQLDKRQRKLSDYDYGDAWAVLDGEGEIAVITWGSSHGAVSEAAERLRAADLPVRVIALRLLAPARPENMRAALAGVARVLVVEQSHGAQFHHYLRAHYDLPGEVRVLARPGPLPLRPVDIERQLREWH